MLVAAFVPLRFVLQRDLCEEQPQVVRPPRRARIVVAGDLIQHTPQLTAARQTDGSYDFSESFRYVAPCFRDADLAVVNLETTLSREGSYSGYPCFCSPAEVADAMVDMGVDVALLANNHCLDRGTKGVRSTADILDSCGIVRMGVFRDSVDYAAGCVCYMRAGDVRLAMVNYTYGTNGIPVPKGVVVNLLDTVYIGRELALIERDKVDCVVAFVHWGNEYERKPNRDQRRVAEFMKRNGVDIIVGSHPHVVQPYEIDSEGKIVVYSLGNFVSNQSKRYTDGGLIVTIDIEEDSAGELKYYLDYTPVWVSRPKYAILPPAVGDTLRMNGEAREAYRIFMTDTRKLLSAK
ncbi:MAG: CapA family protein [Alistipes sp.]|nr:CapA family protein [Alistipes sp.]